MTHCTIDFHQLAVDIKHWGQELGFQQVGIADTNLKEAESHLLAWLKKKFHGEMSYMEKHGTKRSRPEELLPDTLRIISVRLDYLPPDISMTKMLQDKSKAYIAGYALGRDYHKVFKKRLQLLANKINEQVGSLSYRAFVDSAPVLEKAIAEKAGLGWIGKNTLLINNKAGSWFFLGEIYVNIPLPEDKPTTKHCGSCTACIDICPTKAIVGPYQLDARKCISYLTIESKSAIPLELRSLIGNRIFGCDDCQFICPWNKFAKVSTVTDFKPREHLTHATLIDLFNWSESSFNQKTEGSAIRRTGYEGWLRNIAVALGNAPYSPDIISALQNKQNDSSELVREHIAWGLDQQALKI